MAVEVECISVPPSAYAIPNWSLHLLAVGTAALLIDNSTRVKPIDKA